MRHQLRTLSLDDVPAATRLCREAGWNQIAADWLRLLKHEPQGCFAAEVQGSLVGTVTTTCYGQDLAWIGMMLVSETHRRQGIATSLMNHALEYLRGRDIRCVRLDATPAGQAVYEKLGFQPEQVFSRWSRDGSDSDANAMASRRDPLTEVHLAIDQHAFAADRSSWLKGLANDSQVITDRRGYGMMRSGYLADYLGPIVATNAESAKAITLQLLDRSPATRIFWDVFDPIAEQAAQSLGFRAERPFVRMRTGAAPAKPPTGIQFAIGDPGTG